MPPILDNDKGVCERVFFADFMRVNSPILDESRMNTIADSMDHPITDYWIASSHNTYLEGDQECDFQTSGQFSSVFDQLGPGSSSWAKTLKSKL